MASQIAHIVYAKKYFDSLDLAKVSELSSEEKLAAPRKELNRDEFILGCVFPDIRRIDGNIKREDTHLKFPKLDLDFSGLSSFEAGWKFHLFCDMRREEILNKHKFYNGYKTDEMCIGANKILEDEIVYSSWDNWEKIEKFFNNPPYIETNIGITAETFNLWYAILANYCQRKPDEKSERAFLVKMPSLAKKINEIMAAMSKLREDKKAVEILGKIKEEII